MTVIGTIMLGAALLMLCCTTVLLYISIITPTRTEVPKKRSKERRSVSADWDRIMQETKLEKGGKRK